jgi:integrase
MACIRKRRSKWVVDYRDPLGRRRWETCETRKQAEGVLERVLHDSKQASLPAVNPDIRFAPYAESWLTLVASSLKPRSVDGYREKLKNHVLPAFGSLKIRDIHRARIKALLASKLEAQLSVDTVRLIHATLRVVLSAAVEDGILLANPALNLGRQLRLGRSRSARQENVRAFDRDQVARFLGEADARFRPLFLLMARAGLRLGEALALKWDDLDLSTTERMVRVERSVSPDGLHVDTPKSGHGRTVDMSLALREAMLALRASQAESALKDGSPQPDLVFPSEAGGHLDQANVRRAFRRALKRAALPLHHTPHSLRHTFASLLLQAGISPAYVQRQLGHASIQLTVDTYGRWLPMGNKANVDGLDDALEPGGSKTVANGTTGEADPLPDGTQDVEGPREEVVRPGRFELPTYRFVVCCSIQLS